ncbi:MAG: hypothetical protein NWE89_05635 [Candidatus Bathyarchaeota archaeon]|nr:hypothetical protein [Candidatus Bathyarchaeota archaeon]
MISRNEIESFSLNIGFLSDEEKEETRLSDVLLNITLSDYNKLTYDFTMMAQAFNRLPAVMFQGTFSNMNISEHGISVTIQKEAQYPEQISDKTKDIQPFNEESINKITNDVNYLIGVISSKLGSIRTEIDILLDIRTNLNKPTIENHCLNNDFKKKVDSIYIKEEIKLTGLKIESKTDEIKKGYVITERVKEKESDNELVIIYSYNSSRVTFPININSVINESIKDVIKITNVLNSD